MDNPRDPRGTSSNKSKQRTSSHGNSFFSTKLCSSCVQPLGLFISRGSCCPKCGLKVCKKCKIYEVHAPTWCCLACYKIMRHSRGGIVNSNNIREDARSGGIKRSFSISETNRSSPVLKSYTMYYEDRPYNSLPRMASHIHNFGGEVKEGHRSSFRGSILEKKSSLFQSTLHPFRDIHHKKSPTSSVNFIEDEYWDYYDYVDSNRSSCERSLGETVEYQHCVNECPPRKPERRKCKSMGAFDAKYSQLKTYCVITKEPGKDRGSYSSLPRKPKNKLRGEFEKENSITFINGPATNNKAFENDSRRNSSTKNKQGDENHDNFSSTGYVSSSPGLKNRSIVNVKHDKSEPHGELETFGSVSQNHHKVPKSGHKITHEILNSNAINVPSEPIRSETLPLYKNQSIHSSLRKNKYLDFYNGFGNKAGPGNNLYFSLPPMKDRESPTKPKQSPSSGIERDIPIQLQNFRSSKNYPSQIDPMQNPYLILEQLKRKSEELASSSGSGHAHAAQFGVGQKQRPKSFTMPKRHKNSDDSIFTSTTTPRRTKSPNPPLYNNKKESESIDKASGGLAGREVIIVIERESDFPNEPKSSMDDKNQKNQASYEPQDNHKGDCDLIETRASTTSAQSDANPIIVSPTPNTSSINPNAKPKCKSHAKSGNNSNSRINPDSDKKNKMEILESEIASCLSSSSSSASSFLSNLEEDTQDFTLNLSTVFHDCFESSSNNDLGFKSCEDEDEDDEKYSLLKKSSGVEWKGGNEEQVRGKELQLQWDFSPGSEVSSTTSTTTSNTSTSTVKETETMKDLLLSQPQVEYERNNVNENMVTTEPETVVLPIVSNTIANHILHAEMNSSCGRGSGSTSIKPSPPSSSTTKKFKSRIIVNADCCDYSKKDTSDGITNVSEFPGDQVGIVTGRGTFIRPCSHVQSEHDESLNEKVRFRPYDEILGPNKKLVVTNEKYYTTNTKENDLYNFTKSSVPDPILDEMYNEYGPRLPNDSKYEYNDNAISIKSSSQEIQEKSNDLNINSEICKTGTNIMTSSKSPFSCRRESPEGEESSTGKTKFDSNLGSNEAEGEVVMASPPTRSSPDGADKSDDSSPTPTNQPIIEEPTEDDGDSTDSWTEEATVFEDDEKPPPLDLTLHTIVEESCEESEPEPDIPKKCKLNELEKYYNFTTEEPMNYEESEFSDTFSESSLSFDLRNSVEFNGDPFELETGRLEKYFLNLGLNNDSDSVGSESDSECSVLDNRKKVLKHHRRSAEFEDSQDLVSEDDECAFEQDGLDTIKKQRKMRRSSEDLLDSSSSGPNPIPMPVLPDLNTSLEFKENKEYSSETISQNPSKSSSQSTESLTETKGSTTPTPGSVSRSNSFTWSSDEEVNLMMSKLRSLIKNMVQIKKVDEQKNDKLIYLENELVRLMKNENIKNIVESISSDSDDDVYKLFERVENNQPELLSKVMTHIGKRLSTWMKDTDEFTDDGATIKCAPSVSSDLNEDRFSWKGSFESTLAKRQSVGSSDSIDEGGGTGAREGNELFSERSILRSSSLHHLATSQPILEECEPLASSLPRLNDHPITSRRTKNALIGHQEVKSGRYRPPGYFENLETHVSTPTLNTFSANKFQEGFQTTRKNITIRGAIEFLMQYNYKCSTFELCIKQCRDLAAVDTKRGRSDPYVKVYLLPERAKSSKKKTKVKKNTLNPMFGEVLKFPVTLEELENRILWLTVWHSGLFGKNEFLGEVLLNLRNITFDDVNYKWFPLQEQRPIENFSADESQSKSNMVLSLALKWSPRTFNRGNLTILIKEAKGLKYIKNSLPSTFVKCSPINDKSKKQKTSLCRKTLNPVWNTTLTFENISNEGIELAFYNYDLLNHELISSVKLDPDCDVWREMGKREGFWVEGIATFE